MTTFLLFIYWLWCALVVFTLGRIYQYHYALPRISEAARAGETNRKIQEARMHAYMLAEKLFKCGYNCPGKRRNRKRDNKGQFRRAT